LRGRTADNYSPGREGVAQSPRQPDEKLVAHTIGAHLAYLEALITWERALHATSCDLCRPRNASMDDLARFAEQAEAEKERRRAAFRDLSTELGYVPIGEGTALPAEPLGCPCDPLDSTESGSSAS